MGYDGKHCGEIERANKIVREIIHAKGIDIGIYTKDFENEYISLTDIAKYRNDNDPRFVIQNWMQNRNTVEFWRSGRNFTIRILTVYEYERINGDAPLEEKDIKHKILVIKINRLYQRGMDEKVLYDAVRGVWRASKEKVKTVEYVFGVYNSLIVAVYKPSEWFVCKEAKDKLPRQDIVLTPKTENRVFFVDERYEQGLPLDENEEFYLGKSIAGLKLNQSAQNPITYLYPLEKDKIHI